MRGDGAVQRIVIGLSRTIAPIGQRQIIVDTDKVDIRIGPQRIEMEQQRARHIAGLVCIVFRPVGGITDLDRRPQNGAHIGGQRAQLRDSRVARRAIARSRQPAEFGADQKPVHPTGRSTKMGIVQHHAAITPVTTAGPRHRCSVDGET